MKRLMLVVAIAALASGCSSMPKVQPWEKRNLANKEIAFDPHTLETRFADHTYFSK